MIHRKTLSEEIRDSLVNLIDDGSLGPGQRLPSERELCQSFGVARTSVREALQGLICLGRAERRGNRVLVTDGPSNGEGFPNPLQVRIRELFEVRRLIEVSIVEVVACRASASQRSELVRMAAIFSQEMALAEFRACDRAFHEAVAQACGNELLRDLYDKVLDSLFRSEDFESLSRHPDAGPTRELVKLSCLDHRRISDAIMKGDIPAASAAVVSHLNLVETRLIKESGDDIKTP
jgi:GntR family transcriptional repressor for pyruvate dehydrogenase complex